METLMGSEKIGDWKRLTEMLLGPVPEAQRERYDSFEPKHKASG